MTAVATTRAQEIATLHGEIQQHLRTTLDHAIRIGELLTAQKAELAHGQWLPWLRENAPFAERTARDYMRFYYRRDELKTARLADLSDARRYLGGPSLLSLMEKQAETLEQIARNYPRGLDENDELPPPPTLPNHVDKEEVISAIDAADDADWLLSVIDASKRITAAYSEISMRSKALLGQAIKAGLPGAQE